MSENISLNSDSKEGKYKELIPQLIALTEVESDLIANLGNVCSVLKHFLNYYWVGFYIVKSHELVLGPFQGTLACTRIAFGKGVCGTSWKEQKTIVVDNVNDFPGHIACSSASLSEIVVPVIKNHSVVAVLDIDHDRYAAFDETDKLYLEELCNYLSRFF